MSPNRSRGSAAGRRRPGTLTRSLLLLVGLAGCEAAPVVEEALPPSEVAAELVVLASPRLSLAAADGVDCDPDAVETNIVNFDVSDAPAVVARAAKQGVLVNAIAPTRIRAVTHLDVTTKQCEHAVQILAKLAAA